jgi:hypothetical protein
LIPIKIDFEFENRKIKDIFLWDKSEPYWDLETFSKIYVEELNLPAHFEIEIAQSMKK